MLDGGLITWRDLVAFVGDEADDAFAKRVRGTYRASQTVATWDMSPYHVGDGGMWVSSLEALEEGGGIIVDTSSMAHYFATKEAIFEFEDVQVRIICAHDARRRIIPQVWDAFVRQGHDFVPTRRPASDEPAFAPGVARDEVAQVLSDIATTSPSMSRGVSALALDGSFGRTSGQVCYLSAGEPLGSTHGFERNSRLFAVVLSWAAPEGSRMRASTEGRHKLRSTYREVALRLTVPVRHEVSATLRLVQAGEARRRLVAWLEAIGASPSLVDGPSGWEGDPT